MKKTLLFLWGLLKNNWVLKAMALLFAVVLWSYVLTDTNPVREDVLANIPVSIKGAAQLEANDLAIARSLSDQLETAKANVRVEFNQSDRKYISDSSVSMSVDLSKITGPGEWELKIEYTSTRCNVVEVSPATVTVYVDEDIDRTLTVDMQTTGTVASGYYATEPTAEPQNITISGARVDVEKASRAVCNVDISGLKHWDNQTLNVAILDSEGNEIDTSLFDSLPSVIVDMTVLPMKAVPVNAAAAIIGQDNLAAGYEVTDILCDPATVNIVGDASVLAGVDAIDLVPFSVSGASGDVVVPLAFSLPEGVTVLNAQTAQVTVTIREKTRSETFGGVPIEIRSLNKGFSAQLSQYEVDATVLAGLSAMSKLQASDVIAYVDLNGLGVGAHTVTVQFEIPEGFDESNFSALPLTITVTITRG